MEIFVGQRESNTHSPPPTAIAEAFFSKVLQEPVSGVLEGQFLEFSLVDREQEDFCIGGAWSPRDRDHENQVGACLTDRGIIRVIIMTRGGNACMSRMAGEGRIKANLLYAGFSCHGNFHYLALWKGRARERGGGGRGKMERDRRKKERRAAEREKKGRCLGGNVTEKAKQVEKSWKENVSLSVN